MQLILQGNVRQFPLPQLLSFFAQYEHSGTLDVEAKPKRARIFLRDGRVIWAEASGVSDVQLIVLDACMWESGGFTMLDEVVLPDGVTAHKLEVPALLEELERRKAIAAKYPDDTALRVVEDSPQDQLSLTPEELRLLIRIGLGRTFGELAVGRDRVDLAKALMQLEEKGLVVRAGAQADAVPFFESPQPAAPPPAPEPQRREAAEAAASTPKPKPKAEPKPEPKPAPKAAPPPPPPPEEVPTAKQQLVTPEATKRTAGNQLIASLTTDSGAAFALVEDEQSIGRDSSNAIAVPDGSISVRHARITRTPQGFFIEDIGSRNGTFVNSEKVLEKRLLADNDLIRLGKVIFTFNVAAELRKGDTTAGGTSRP